MHTSSHPQTGSHSCPTGQLTYRHPTSPPTAVPCPSWCESGAGHPYEMGNPATGHEIRDHRVTFGDTGVAATDISATATYVEGAEMFAPLVIGVVIHGNMHESDLTSAEEARTLAAHLLVAAERLDELNGSDR